MLSVLLLTLGVQDRMDVRQPAAIGEVMVRRLSEQFGVTIKTDATLAQIPLIVNVPNVTFVGSSRVDLQACKLEYSIVSPK